MLCALPSDDKSHDTWEDEANILDPSLIAEFDEQRLAGSGKKAKH